MGAKQIHIIYRERPTGIEFGEVVNLRQVWNRFTGRDYYFCPNCRGWLEGKVDQGSIFERPMCLRCRKPL